MNQSKLFAIAAAAAVMVSCGNEDGGGSTPLTPEENKEKLDRIGMDVIDMINPVNHEDFCEAVDHFVEFSDEGNLGDVFHDPNAYSLMASTMQALKTACTKGDISGLLTKTEVTDYIYRAEDYYGVYNYRNGRWTYTEDDSKLEFRYSFNGDDIVATAVASGEESLVSYTDRWTEPGYEDWNGNYHPGEEYEYNYDVYVPEKVEVNFTKNGESLASVTVNTDCQMNDHVNIDVSYAVADMDGSVAVDLDNSNGSASYSLNMGGRNIVTGSTVFSGSDMADPDEAAKSVERMFGQIVSMESADSSSNVFESMTELTSKYLYDPNSPFRDEDLYLPFVKGLSGCRFVPEGRRVGYEYDAEMCSLNRKGTAAADFVFCDRNGRRYSLYGIKADYVILFFSNPGCTACKQIIDELNSDARINDMISAGRLVVLNIYIDSDLAEWKKYMPIYPDTWYNGYDPDYVIRTDVLYNVRAIPSLYLLDKDKKVLMKDVPQEKLFRWLENIPS